MAFKIISILIVIALSLAIPLLSILEYAKAQNIGKGYPLNQVLDSQNPFSKKTPQRLQHSHPLVSIFDNSYFGSMAYE